ncbi:MAG: hypothetical protein R3E87_05065 [Burkholderiaceae bacterium]
MTRSAKNASENQRMIKPWAFEFVYSPNADGEEIAPGRAIDEHPVRAVEMFGEQMVPVLRKAHVA